MTADLQTMTERSEATKLSPDYVRISAAAAIELGLKPGRLHRCNCGCINLLQNYPEGCFANCSYCGLARERPGIAELNTFIRVDWPLYLAQFGRRNTCHRSRESLYRSGSGRQG